ncbi:GNAT family N-acetyltransferase [Erythrobacter sp. Alg231-14]|uniref:GNAT family N-acetyltransferase n=1 Tax=Erythrobacter sp. Alg231-14 TaxID=1922225 RepID=UPI00307C2F37
MTASPETVMRIMTVMNQAFDPMFGEAWNHRQVADALTMPNTHAIVVDINGNAIEEDISVPNEAAGFVLTRHAADEEELLLIAVLPECRGRGLGQKLIDRLLKTSRNRGIERMFLEMRRGNPAIHLYQKLGFEPIGERLKYYTLSDGSRVDAITFGVKL